MIVLADYNLNRQAMMISGSLLTGGWLDLVPMQLMTFEGLGLPPDSSDRVVWSFAQRNGMLLLTASRSAVHSITRLVHYFNFPLRCLPAGSARFQLISIQKKPKTCHYESI